ncbi:MAG: hypothetical protein AAGF97_06780, partial [Planctomycetota bacterium]
VEIQVASLSSIRDKIKRLVKQHQVLVVKPIVCRKQLVWLDQQDGNIVRRRYSPKRGTLLDAFHELMYFTQVFPHPNLQLELPLIDIEEWRYRGHGKRRRWRKNDFEIQDRKLVHVHEATTLATRDDLRRLADCKLPKTFHTGDLAQGLKIDRWIAQRIAYCFRKMKVTRQVGKSGNALLYEFTQPKSRAPRRRARKASPKSLK